MAPPTPDLAHSSDPPRGRQANPWGSGTSYQSVAPTVTRAGLMQGTGTAGACDGPFSKDLNALWCPTCLSEPIEFQVGP